MWAGVQVLHYHSLYLSKMLQGEHITIGEVYTQDLTAPPQIMHM